MPPGSPLPSHARDGPPALSVVTGRMTPMRTHTVMASPIGDLTLVAEGGALVSVGMVPPVAPQSRSEARLRQAGTDELGERDDASLAGARTQLEEYFAGERRQFDLDLAPHGDAFQLQVWALLQQIPYGETRSYGDLARQLGDVHLSQAVGTANGRNPISIVIPCHRVIGSDGSLVGYAGGLDRKRFLLSLEEPAAADASRLF
jgi:methylated-DNA-[protein]-cysteine S-methyltransferase